MDKVLFLTTSHHYNDDRILYHQAKELVVQGYEVMICSLSSDFEDEMFGVKIQSFNILDKVIPVKKEAFEKVISDFKPQIIIASEPLAVIATKKYKKKHHCKVFYDITEWYPSIRMVENDKGLKKIFQSIKFFLIQLYAGYLSSAFIFGERTKRFPLAFVFPFKKSIILPYFPSKEYITTHIKNLDQHRITLCYTGLFVKEKGIANFFKAADQLRNLRKDLNVKLLLIGGTRNKQEIIYFENLLAQYNWDNLVIKKPVAFQDFTLAYQDADICFDLRDLNFENHHCLPIKLFYYAASGKPVIYSKLKAIQKHVDVNEFGFLVDPDDSNAIVNCVSRYIDDPKLYSNHAHQAFEQFSTKNNWENIKQNFVDFIKL